MAKAKDIIVIFDVGVTYTQHLLVDRNFHIIEKTEGPEIRWQDTNTDMVDELVKLVNWVRKTAGKITATYADHLLGVNFLSDATKLVHIDQNDDVIHPPSGRLKPFPHYLYKDFEYRHNKHKLHPIETGTPGVGMMNTGFQMFYLKYHRPFLYGQIRCSLHLPQYLSFLFTGIPLTDFTSIGCHSAMWNFQKKSIHEWVRQEHIDKKLAPLVKGSRSVNVRWGKRQLEVGVGIDKTSARLLPYIMSIKEPFVLVSTGQWSIALNPFYGGSLSIHDIAKGCMFYMLPDGHPVLGHRLTVGDKYQQQLQRLATFYSVSIKKIHKIRYDKSRHKKIMKAHHRYFDFAHLEHQPSAIEMLTFDDISHAYHQLMAELVDYHISGISHVLKDANVQKIFVEGEFATNRLFMKMLARRLKTYVIQKSTLKMSSAIGAALALKSNWWNAKFLHRSLKKA